MSRKSSDANLLPTTYLAVLTLVARGARYGYEINSLIERYGYRNWVDMKFSSIYKALKELEAKGLVKGVKEKPSLRTSRKLFSLTPKGHRLLKKQIRTCLSNPPRVNTVFDLGLSAMFLLPRDDVIQALREYYNSLSEGLSFLKAQVETLRNLEKYQRTEPYRMIGNQTVSQFDGMAEREVVLALFERPAKSVVCQLEWLEDFIIRVEEGEGFSFKE